MGYENMLEIFCIENSSVQASQNTGDDLELQATGVLEIPYIAGEEMCPEQGTP